MADDSDSPSRRRPRRTPPPAPSTRPPSSANTGRRRSHEVFVEIASLKMAKARQERIRSSLQDQIDSCTAEIERIEQKLQALYRRVGLEETDAPAPASRTNPSDDGDEEDGFEYEY